MRWLIAVLAVFSVLSCTTPGEPRHPLVKQILKPRVGHTGLTNRVCLEYDLMGSCKRPEIIDYSFDDAEFQKTVNDLGFICKVGSKRYKICLGKAGLCRISYEKKGWFSKPERKEEYLPASGYQFLLDSDTRCFQKDEYSFDDL